MQLFYFVYRNGQKVVNREIKFFKGNHTVYLLQLELPQKCKSHVHKVMGVDLDMIC